MQSAKSMFNVSSHKTRNDQKAGRLARRIEQVLAACGHVPFPVLKLCAAVTDLRTIVLQLGNERLNLDIHELTSGSSKPLKTIPCKTCSASRSVRWSSMLQC